MGGEGGEGGAAPVRAGNTKEAARCRLFHTHHATRVTGCHHATRVMGCHHASRVTGCHHATRVTGCHHSTACLPDLPPAHPHLDSAMPDLLPPAHLSALCCCCLLLLPATATACCCPQSCAVGGTQQVQALVASVSHSFGSIPAWVRSQIVMRLQVGRACDGGKQGGAGHGIPHSHTGSHHIAVMRFRVSGSTAGRSHVALLQCACLMGVFVHRECVSSCFLHALDSWTCTTRTVPCSYTTNAAARHDCSTRRVPCHPILCIWSLAPSHPALTPVCVCVLCACVRVCACVCPGCRQPLEQ